MTHSPFRPFWARWISFHFLLRLFLGLSIFHGHFWGSSLAYAYDGQEVEEFQKEVDPSQKAIMDKLEAAAMGGGSGAGGGINTDVMKALIEIGAQKKGKTAYVPYDVTVKQVEDSLAQTPLKGFAKAYPKIVHFVAKAKRDPKFLQILLEGLNDSNKIHNYRIVAIVIFCIYVLLNFFGETKSLWKRLLKKLFLAGFLFVGQFLNIIFFFPTQFQAVFKLAKEVFWT